MWVRVFRKGTLEIAINTNNGAERKNKDFKYQFPCKLKDKSLSGMVTVLVEQFLMKKYEK